VLEAGRVASGAVGLGGIVNATCSWSRVEMHGNGRLQISRTALGGKTVT
jgi:hypothetical protein